MDGICYIVGSGDFTPDGLCPQRDDYVIAADGGYRYLENAHIRTDLLVGDFDSLDYVPDNIKIYRFPAEKDDTDMGLALKKGEEKGYRRFRIYAGSGSRPDHFYANLQLLARFAMKGYEVSLHAPEFNVYALYNGRISLKREKGTVFSVFAVTDTVNKVTIENAKYETINQSLKNTFPLGVSNEFTENETFILAKGGAVIVFEYLKKRDD